MMVVSRYTFMAQLRNRKYLLINSLSSAVDVVQPQVVEALRRVENGESPELPADTMDQLIQRGYLFHSRDEESQLIMRAVQLNNRRRAETKGLAFMLCPTFACNLRCTYCYEPHQLHNIPAVMTRQQVEKAFEAIDILRAARPEMEDASIALYGGEPLLKVTMSAVERILVLAEERQLPIEIISNGTEAHHFLKMLLPYRDSLVVVITLDGMRELHDQRRFLANGKGTFDIIARNVDSLLANGFRVTLRMNLDQNNIGQIDGFLSYVEEHGWNSNPDFLLNPGPVHSYSQDGSNHNLISPEFFEQEVSARIPPSKLASFPVAYAGNVNRLRKAVETLLDGEKRFTPSVYYCESAGLNVFVMGPDGYIYPCNQTVGQVEWAIGRFDPALVLDHEKMAPWLNRSVDQVAQCKGCDLAFICAGGCPVMAAKATGTVMSSFCGSTRADVKSLVHSLAVKYLDI